MSARRVIPLVISAGMTLVFGCSYDWNVGSEADGGGLPISASGSTSSSGAGTSSNSSSSSGATPVDAGKAGPANGNCGNNCTCAAGQTCDFDCAVHRTCKLTCESKSTCKFTCPTNSTCEVSCKDGATCDFTVQTGAESTSSCSGKPAACTGACAVGANCENKCDKDQCNVQCAGILGGSTQCHLH